MNREILLQKMQGCMYKLSQTISAWFGANLTKIDDDWWQVLIINCLTDNQRTRVRDYDISSLDLAMLLRVLDRNWFVIKSTFYINDKEREHVKDLIEARNVWSHPTPDKITKERAVYDINRIVSLMGALDVSSDDISEIEQILISIERDSEFIDNALKNDLIENKVVSDIVSNVDEHISLGDAVSLISDASTIGAVTKIEGNKYTVLINGTFHTYFSEQIKKFIPDTQSKFLALNKVKAAITAYQINNPGSSNLYSLNSARIDFVPYQFRPALKMIKSDSPKLLVADDVGVGKTIEAGLILKEMEARASISSVLIICPRPLISERKWVLEMKRFDEDFTQLDGKELQACISETDRDGDWPERHSKTIIPYSLFSEDTIMGTRSNSDKKYKTIGLSELDPIPHFDLVIVDEAHTIRNSQTWAYRGVELFCQNADSVVFLTATPLQNKNDDLFTLLNLLRPDIVTDKETFVTMAEPNRNINNLLRIARKQEAGWQAEGQKEIADLLSTSWGRNVIQHNPVFSKVFNFFNQDEVTREEKVTIMSCIEELHSFNGIINRTRRKDIGDFCVRRTETEKVSFTQDEYDLYEALMSFEERALSRLHGSRNVRFMMSTIRRQAASCIHAVAPFVNDLVNKRMDQLADVFYEYDYSYEDEASLDELAYEIEEYSKNLSEVDNKYDRLKAVVSKKQEEENNRVIVFSSFIHTLNYLKKKLEADGIRVAQVDGNVKDDARYAIRQRFALNRDDDDAIDVLLFSEIGCEGLDYQFCDTMINYDLPWNPMRIEQRIGRIDRRGQKSEAVKIYNMIIEGTIDEVIYDRCLSKIGIFESSIGECSDILGNISEQISQIMFSAELTEKERYEKIEQLADNEVKKIQELNRLEEDEKSLYGFDLSDYILKKDVQDAESVWISPVCINNLLDEFFNDYLGEGEYIKGKGNVKSLKLSQEKRKLLLDGLKDIEPKNYNNAFKLWRSYLKSTSPQISITFDGESARDNMKTAFLTQMHPLILQAAIYESKLLPCDISISAAEGEFSKGDYEFAIYSWKYVGLKSDVKLVAICKNPDVQNEILSIIQQCTEAEEIDGIYDDAWNELDNIHYKKWQISKANYAKDVSEQCDFRIEQLIHSINKQANVVRKQIDEATDERIVRMRQSQLSNIEGRFEDQKVSLEAAKDQADIHTELLVRGVLHVE